MVCPVCTTSAAITIAQSGACATVVGAVGTFKLLKKRKPPQSKSKPKKK
jgi:hypothetical protein